MSDFYDRAAATATRLLRPSDQGGLGARTGSISYLRANPAVPPANPWEPPAPTSWTELDVRAQSFGISKQLIGTEIGNTAMIATDLYVICERIPDGYQPTDVIEIDGQSVMILGVERIPAAGVASAVKFFIRR